MKSVLLNSGQFHNGSDIHGRKNSSSATATQAIVQSAADQSRIHNAKRFSYRTLQTLWQSKLQVCRNTRAWPKILPFDKYARIAYYVLNEHGLRVKMNTDYAQSEQRLRLIVNTFLVIA
jgi:hypothetical protein